MLVAQLADQVLAFLALQLHLVQCRRQLIGHLRELADDAVLLVHAVLQALEFQESLEYLEYLGFLDHLRHQHKR